MAVLDKLEKKFRRFGISNITLYLVFGQALVYVMAYSGKPQLLQSIALVPILVLRGEIWRIFSFVFTPPASHPIFLFFALYLLYIMGSALENYWGTFRYNIFLLIGYVATVAASFAASFITPYASASVIFLGGSIFLAFATLNPDFQLMLFFMIPVKIKWLALLTWLGYGYTLLFGGWMSRFLMLASLCNYFIFFGRDIALRIRAGRWKMERQAQEFARRNEPNHRCVLCGITDKDNPDMTFRYCTKCAGTPCYCLDHIQNHEHITTSSE